MKIKLSLLATGLICAGGVRPKATQCRDHFGG